MVLRSAHGLPPAQITALLDCHPAIVRRWISRFNHEGPAGLADRPRSGRPRLGGRQLTGRIAALLARPGPWTLPRILRYLDKPGISMRMLYRRVRLVAIWRRPKLTARGDPAHDHVVAQIVARLIELPRRAVVLAEDETHLNLLPHVRVSWTLRTARPQIPTPGANRQVTVFGTLEVTTGAWVYRLGRRCAADFIALLDQVLRAFPQAPAVVVICDNDSIHHAHKVTAYLEKHPRLELLYGARYSPHDNPVERIWAALKNYVANTAMGWPGRLRQIHSFFATAHRARCWPPLRPGPAPGYRRVTSRTSGMRLSLRDSALTGWVVSNGSFCGFELRFCVCRLVGVVFGRAPYGCGDRRAGASLQGIGAGTARGCCWPPKLALAGSDEFDADCRSDLVTAHLPRSMTETGHDR